MKKKRTLKLLSLAMIGTLAVSGLASCSQDDEPTTSRSQDAVSFNPLFSSSERTSRATPTTAANYLSRVSDFKVWSYYTGTTEYYLGRQGNAGIYITHTSGKSDWDYKTSTDVVFWPKTALNFYAVTPSDNANYSYTGQNLVYSVPTDHSQQVDLMVARAGNQLKTTNGGKVALAFNHMLSQVIFKGTTRSSQMTAEVKSITIHNVRNSITVPLTSGNGTPGSSYSNYSTGLASPVTLNSTTTTKDLTDANGAMLLVPQTGAKWADGSTLDAANGTHQGYLEIECKISTTTSGNGAYLVGSANAYGKIYMPLAISWEPGKRYIYTIIFGSKDGGTGGGGYDPNHNPVLSPISFTVSVGDWTDNGSQITL